MARAAMRLSVTLNATQTQDEVEHISGKLEDRRWILEQLGDAAHDYEVELLRHDGAVDGRKPWKPLKPSTIALKGNDQLFRGTGKLLAALLAKPKLTTASANIRGPEYAVMLAGGRYPKHSSTGSGRRSGWTGLGGYMPRRNPMPMPSRRRVEAIVASLLEGVLGTSGQRFGPRGVMLGGLR